MENSDQDNCHSCDHSSIFGRRSLNVGNILEMSDPSDLSTIPKEFYEREDLKQSPILSDREELVHFRSIIASFMNYRLDSIRDISRMERDLYNLPEKHKKLIQTSLEDRKLRMMDAIDLNYSVLSQIVSKYYDIFTWKKLKTGDTMLAPFFIEPRNVSKMRSTLRQIWREWSKGGEQEREECYGPILKGVEKLFPEVEGRERIRILCPVAENNNS